MVSIVPVDAMEKVFDTLTARKTTADASIYIKADSNEVLDSWRKYWYERRDPDTFAWHMGREVKVDDEQEDSLVLGVEFPQTMQALGTELGPVGDGVFKAAPLPSMGNSLVIAA